MRPAAKHIVEFPVTEVNSVVVLFCFSYLSVFIESPRNIVLEHVIFFPRIPVFFTFMFLSFPLLFVSVLFYTDALKYVIGNLQNCLLFWEVRVIGWDISYGAEFVPNSEENYTVIIQKSRKVGSSEEPVICNNYKIDEPGKVVLTIENSSSKKKKLLYRLKTKTSNSD